MTIDTMTVFNRHRIRRSLLPKGRKQPFLRLSELSPRWGGKQSACPTLSVGTWPGPIPGLLRAEAHTHFRVRIRRTKIKSKKENRITVRLTPEQEESIREKAAEAMMSPSAFLRAAGMRHKTVVIPGIEDLTHELKGIGRNLNQLVILAHEGKISRVDLSGVTAALEKIYGKLTELMTMENR